MVMFIDDAYEAELCLDIVPFYVEDNQKFEEVHWSILDKLYPELRFEKIFYRAKIDLTIAITKIIYDNSNPDYLHNLYRKKYICPKPPGGIKTCKTIVREDGSTFYAIDTLWELMHKLDEDDAFCTDPSWKFEVYIPKTEALHHCNKRYYDFDDIGRETSVTEELYYVKDIDKYVKITEGIKEF